MPIYLKPLTWEERAVYGTCPVCKAEQGKYCKQDAAGGLVTPLEPIGPGAHIARLVNAPQELAVSDEDLSVIPQE